MDEYLLKETFYISRPKWDLELTVPSGIIFDGASIPRICWTTTGSPFLPAFIGPALVHDTIYIKGCDNLRKYTKKEADDVFHKLLRENGVGRYTAWKMHKAVRLFGKGIWG